MKATEKIRSTIYQIDMSGKIEQTSSNTVLVLVNGHKTTILFKKQDKRKLENLFKKSLRSKLFPLLTFSALLALLLKERMPRTKVQIDNEYLSYEGLVLERSISYLKELGIKNYPKLEIVHIGKQAKAHFLALKVAHGKEKPDKTITLRDVFCLLTTSTKNDREFQLKPQDRLTQDWLPGGRRSSRSIRKLYHKSLKKSRLNRRLK